MARKRILPRYVQWRDGRPRWELGGMGGQKLREAGFRSIDLKDQDGAWLSFEQAKQAANRLNIAVDSWRNSMERLTQEDLEAMVANLPPAQRRFVGDFAHLATAAPGLGRPRLMGELVDAHRMSDHWRRDITPGSRKVYTARGNVLKVWLGDIDPRGIQRSQARRWFETLLDVGFARHHAETGNKGKGTEWHERVRDMSRTEKQSLRDRREAAMENDDEISGLPPGYTGAYYTLAYARDLISWANREKDLGLANPFAKLALATPGGRVRYLEADEIQHMAATARAMGRDRLADAIALALGTIQRRGDLLTLGWRIRQEGRFRIIQQKTGKEIDAALPKSTLAYLADAYTRVSAGGVSPAPDTKILPYANAEMLTLDWRDVREQAAKTMPSLADALFHDLRDTGFTRLLEAGASLVDACNLSGHSLKQASVIEKGYMSYRASMADRGISKLDTWMDKGGIAL